MADIACVLFDMDGVLCHYGFPLRLRIMAEALGVPAEEIDARLYRSGFDEASDRGEIGADDYLSEAGRKLGCELPLDLWLAARRRSIAPNLETLGHAGRLSQRLDVAMLTNNNLLLKRHFAEVFPEAAALFGERAWFSAEFGGGKEGTAVFARALDRLGRAPGETLFIDDSPEYIANAARAGLQTHLFEGLSGLSQAHPDLFPTA